MTIPYVDESWNPTSGCSPVGDECRNCWARRMASRLRGRFGYPHSAPFDPVTHPGRLDQPFAWRRPRVVAVSFMGDLFHEAVPRVFVDRVFDTMEGTPRHTFLLLTKRSDRMRDFFRQRYPGWSATFHDRDALAPHNVWAGVTVTDQETANRRVAHLHQTPAALRWISYEPALRAVDLRKGLYEFMIGNRERRALWLGTSLEGIRQVVAGGEAGPGARPCNIEWLRHVAGQCQAAGVPCYIKQLGARPWGHFHADHADRTQEGPHGDLHGPLIAGGIRDHAQPITDPRGADPGEWPEDLRAARELAWRSE